ncbi:MAG TPA: hypothetical protein VLG14_14150 [Sphingomonas sp.]|nr:hypothetical protein [Sphingomonas sp.]
MNGSSKAADMATNGSAAYRAGVGVAALTSFLIVWTTIVRDDGTGGGFFMLILAAGVGGYAARFRPDGMARAMVGVAVMQVLLTLLIVTAPVTAEVPDGVFKAWLFGGGFTVLWLVSAALFRAAARADAVLGR